MRTVGFFREMSKTDSPVYTETLPKARAEASDYSRRDVFQYLNAGYPVLDVMESTTDLIGGAFHVPGGPSVLTDGTFIWRTDLAPYVQHYAIELPADFVDFMKLNRYIIPQVPQNALIEIAYSVSSMLGFRHDPGAAPQS
ncbi:hypothetical protein OG711_20985 [Streptomyces uncialis]|uniref:hypothetical protein n=1 Tax=Streptomyces uncialis TaxID=1048205 RepID=UPI00225717AC|nr:hypothetical protein [Streptomyces uncialis]MCX4664858.1 hypothetical protein [Streptomyces uncialis]